MNTHFTYRWLTLDDLELLLKYRIEFLKGVQQVNDPERERQLYEHLKAYFQLAIPEQTFWGIVAEEQGDVQAFGAMVIDERPGVFGNISGKSAYVLNMYTLPQGRSKGLATTLLQKLIIKAKSLGIDTMSLVATEQGRSIYEKAGFKTIPYPYLELKLNL